MSPRCSMPLFDAPMPAPYQGTSRESRAASYSGAVHAMKGRGEKVAALRQLLKNHGPLTFNAVSAITGWPIASVCSLKDALGDEVEAQGVELVDWGSGRTTRRMQWGIRR